MLLVLGLARFAYGWVGFWGFSAFRGLFLLGYILGLLRLCRVEVFKGLEFFCAYGLLGLLTVG